MYRKLKYFNKHGICYQRKKAKSLRLCLNDQMLLKPQPETLIVNIIRKANILQFITNDVYVHV